jgi:alpha-N-arabinofuranosidase
MTGMERNSDLVIMSSYAPLFVNVNPGGMQWETDLIGYDTLTSYGSPSYYAQLLFANHVGTEVVASTLNAGPRLYTSVTRDEKQRKIFVKIVNATSDEQPLGITLSGAPNVKRSDQRRAVRASFRALLDQCAGAELLSKVKKLRIEHLYPTLQNRGSRCSQG